MYDTEGNKRICILDNLFDFQQPRQYIHLKEKKKESYYKYSKETSAYWKRKDKIFNIF